LHGGSVKIESRPSAGTTISCHLPAAIAPAAAAQHATLTTGSPV